MYIDKLTGLKNSNYLDSAFSKYLFPGTCFILIDVDNFKDFNTKFGYELADEVLKAFASIMKKVITPEIEIVRYKFGDEFLIITKGKSINDGLLFVENLKTSLVNSVMRINNEEELVYFSFGVTEYEKGDDLTKINMRLINSLAIQKKEKHRFNSHQ